MSEHEHGQPQTHLDAARAAASSSKRQPGDLPAAVDMNYGRRAQPSPVKPVWSNASYTPTPSLDPGNVKAIENYDENDPVLAQALNAFSTAHETLKQISAARDPLSRDQSKTPEQKLLLMATHTDKAQTRCTKAFDSALKNLTTAADEIDRQLTAPLEQVTHSAMCQEIRAYIRGLDKDQRGAFINDAVKRGDMQVMNAVLGAPDYLSGIHAAQKAVWLRQYREAKDPIAVMRLAVYRRAIDLIGERAPLIHSEFEKAMGGAWKDVRRLRGQVEASDKALAALRGSGTD